MSSKLSEMIPTRHVAEALFQAPLVRIVALTQFGPDLSLNKKGGAR